MFPEENRQVVVYMILLRMKNRLKVAFEHLNHLQTLRMPFFEFINPCQIALIRDHTSEEQL
ncbi:hypothetical protein D3C73_1624170 [compost metagenome]